MCPLFCDIDTPLTLQGGAIQALSLKSLRVAGERDEREAPRLPGRLCYCRRGHGAQILGQGLCFG